MIKNRTGGHTKIGDLNWWRPTNCSHCVVSCQMGWRVIACGAGRLGNQGSGAGLCWFSAAAGTGAGSGFCEELVHDFGACGDDWSQFAAVDDLGCPGGGVSDEAGDFFDADAVVAEQADE